MQTAAEVRILAQDSDRPLLQLADPLRGQMEFLPNRGETGCLLAGQPVASLEDLPQPGRKLGNRVLKLMALLRPGRCVFGVRRPGIGERLPERYALSA